MFGKNIVALLAIILLFGTQAEARKVAKRLCKSAELCKDVNNPNCLCYCAFKPGPRAKVPGQDKPLFIEDDPFGHHCYCAPRDWKKINEDNAGMDMVEAY